MNVPAKRTQKARGKAHRSSSSGAGAARGCSTMTGGRATGSRAPSLEFARTESGKAHRGPCFILAPLVSTAECLYDFDRLMKLERAQEYLTTFIAVAVGMAVAYKVG